MRLCIDQIGPSTCPPCLPLLLVFNQLMCPRGWDVTSVADIGVGQGLNPGLLIHKSSPASTLTIKSQCFPFVIHSFKIEWKQHCLSCSSNTCFIHSLSCMQTMNYMPCSFAIYGYNTTAAPSQLSLTTTNWVLNLVTWPHHLAGGQVSKIKRNVFRSFYFYFGDSYQYCVDIFGNLERKYM